MKTITILIIALILMGGFLIVLEKVKIKLNCCEDINSFEDCVKAGYPVMESYPRKCMDGDKRRFTEVIEEWKLDGINLMQHETEKYFGCFGCNNELCIDPIQEMKMVEETKNIYCNKEFEVIKN